MPRDPFSSIPGADDELNRAELITMNNCADVNRAVKSLAAQDPGNRRKIMRRAAELGCTQMIPDDWEL